MLTLLYCYMRSHSKFVGSHVLPVGIAPSHNELGFFCIIIDKLGSTDFLASPKI